MEGTRIIVLLLNAFVLAYSADPFVLANQIVLDAELMHKQNYVYYDIGKRHVSFNGVRWDPKCILIQLGYEFEGQNQFGLPNFTLPPTMQFFTCWCKLKWSEFFQLFRNFERNHMREGGLKNINILWPGFDLGVIPQPTDNIPSISNPIVLPTVECMRLPWPVMRELIEFMNQGIFSCPRISRIIVTKIPGDPTDVEILSQAFDDELFTKTTYGGYYYSNCCGAYGGEDYMIIQRKPRLQDYVHAKHPLSLTFNDGIRSQALPLVRNLQFALGRERDTQYLPSAIKQTVLFDYAKDMHGIEYNQYLLNLMDDPRNARMVPEDDYELVGYAMSSLRGLRAPEKSLELSVPHLLSELSLMVFPDTFDTLQLHGWKMTWEDLVALFADGRIPDLALLDIHNCGNFGGQSIPIRYNQLKLPLVQKLLIQWNTFQALLLNHVLPLSHIERCEIDTCFYDQDPGIRAFIQRSFPEQQYSITFKDRKCMITLSHM